MKSSLRVWWGACAILWASPVGAEAGAFCACGDFSNGLGCVEEYGEGYACTDLECGDCVPVAPGCECAQDSMCGWPSQNLRCEDGCHCTEPTCGPFAACAAGSTCPTGEGCLTDPAYGCRRCQPYPLRDAGWTDTGQGPAPVEPEPTACGCTRDLDCRDRGAGTFCAVVDGCGTCVQKDAGPEPSGNGPACGAGPDGGSVGSWALWLGVLAAGLRRRRRL